MKYLVAGNSNQQQRQGAYQQNAGYGGGGGTSGGYQQGQPQNSGSSLGNTLKDSLKTIGTDLLINQLLNKKN